MVLFYFVYQKKLPFQVQKGTVFFANIYLKEGTKIKIEEQ